MDEFEPKIVAFFCNWCSCAGTDLAGVSRPKNGRRRILPFLGKRTLRRNSTIGSVSSAAASGAMAGVDIQF